MNLSAQNTSTEEDKPMKKTLTTTQARNYIETGHTYTPEQYDAEQWTYNHALRLVKTVETLRDGVKSGKYGRDAIETAKHYARSDSTYMQANPSAKDAILSMVAEMEAFQTGDAQ